MALKFSELPRGTYINANEALDSQTPFILIPIVEVGLASNVLKVVSGATFSSFVSNLVTSSLVYTNANVTTLTSNAASQQTSINTLTSGQSSQAGQISTHTGQITTLQGQVSTLQSNLQSNVTTFSGQITALQANTGSLANQISSVQAATLSGVVNSVLVTGPIVKSGNATYPNISLPVATTSANGYLSSTDWTTFNNKAPTNNATFTGTTTVATLNTGSILPSANATSDIGSSSYQFNTVYAKATSAQYADLAELYLADAEYPIGTVLVVGGDAEVTACQRGKLAIGVVSANPSYLMNSGLPGGTCVALKGRVPVRITGPVNKGDEIVAGDNGCAHVGIGTTFAVALASDNNENEKLVEALVL